MQKRNSPCFNPLVKVVTRTLSSVLSIKRASLLKQVTYNLKLSSSHCLMFCMAAEDLQCLYPLMKCVTRCPLNSLKVETMFGVSLLNHTLASPFKVIGKAIHIISSETPCKCMRVLNDSRWLSGSLDPSYALLWGGRKSLMQWTGSQSSGLIHPNWWIPVPLGHSSSCPSFPSSSTYPGLCTSHRLLFWRDS